VKDIKDCLRNANGHENPKASNSTSTVMISVILSVTGLCKFGGIFTSLFRNSAAAERNETGGRHRALEQVEYF